MLQRPSHCWSQDLNQGLPGMVLQPPLRHLQKVVANVWLPVPPCQEYTCPQPHPHLHFHSSHGLQKRQSLYLPQPLSSMGVEGLAQVEEKRTVIHWGLVCRTIYIYIYISGRQFEKFGNQFIVR